VVSQLVPSQVEQLIVERPNFGLYLDRDELSMDPRALSSCKNVRIRDGALLNDLLGWEPFTTSSAGARITFVDEFFDRSGSRALLVGTDKDLLEYDVGAAALRYLTPRYNAGTVSVAGSTVTGVGTLWATADPHRAGELAVQAGDEIAFFATNIRDVAPVATWYPIVGVASDTSLTITGTPVVGAGSSYTIRQRFAGSSGKPWWASMFLSAQGALRDTRSGGVHAAGDDLIYATNGAAIVSLKIGQTDVARLDGDFGLKAGMLVVHKNTLILGNIVPGGSLRPSSVRSSKIAEPETVTGTGSAELALTDAAHELLRLEPLGDVLLAYLRGFDHQSGAIVMLQQVEAPIVWALRTAAPEVAVLAGRAVANLGNAHEFFAADGAYAFDGVQLLTHATHVLAPLSRTVDGGRLDQAIVVRDYEHGEVNWILPLTSDPAGVPADAWIEHYREPRGRGQAVPFGHRELPATAVGYFSQAVGTGLRFSDLATVPDDWFKNTDLRWNTRPGGQGFPTLIFGTDSGALMRLGTSSDQNGTPYVSRATFPLALVVPRGGGALRGYVQRVMPHLRHAVGSPGLVKVAVRVAQDRGRTAVVAKQLEHPLDGSKRYVPVGKLARLAGVEYEASGPSNVFTLDGFSVEVARAGRR
jgi:hypothetical protein